jgi:glycosyltransferase involved in cell wall biosynthesis
MLARRPCLSTGAEGAGELIRPQWGTIVTPENDPDALAAELRGYLDDDIRRRREGEAGRRWAQETFAAPVVATRVEALLQHGCGPGP